MLCSIKVFRCTFLWKITELQAVSAQEKWIWSEKTAATILFQPELSAPSAFEIYIMLRKWSRQPLVPDSLPLSASFTIQAWKSASLSLVVTALHDAESKKAVVWPKEHFKKLRAVWAAAQVTHTHSGGPWLVCLCVLGTCMRLQRCTCYCVCLCMCVYMCVLGEGRPIKKLPEERAFRWESMGGKEDGRAIVCQSSILRAGIRAFLLCSAGRLCTATLYDPVFN